MYVQFSHKECHFNEAQLSAHELRRKNLFTKGNSGCHAHTDLKHVAIAQHVEHGVDVRLAGEVKACSHEPLR